MYVPLFTPQGLQESQKVLCLPIIIFVVTLKRQPIIFTGMTRILFCHFYLYATPLNEQLVTMRAFHVALKSIMRKVWIRCPEIYRK